jgi:lipopolysaccharide cholinephosphotransferase
MTASVTNACGFDLARLQRVLTGMAAQIFAYCRERDIVVTLVAGSALGAVREGAIIPWDDDLDIGMKRADFDRFVACFNADPIPGMFVQHWKTEPKFPPSFAKIRLDGTYVTDTDCLSKEIHQGIFVDVFPFDDVPANFMLEKIQRYGIGLVNLFIERPEIEDPNDIFSIKRKFGRRVARALARFLPPVTYFCRIRDGFLRMRGVRKSGLIDCLGMFGTRAMHRTRFPAEAIFPPVPATLGGVNVLVPADSDLYLTRMYGDWRKPPEVGQQRPFHIVSIDFADHPLSRA